MEEKYLVISEGSVVVCLYDKDLQGGYMIDLPITKGKHYVLKTDVKSYHNYVCITNDDGNEYFTNVDRFVVLSKLRDEAIEKILELKYI